MTAGAATRRRSRSAAPRDGGSDWRPVVDIPSMFDSTSSSMHRRVRWAMYLTLAFTAVLAAAAVWVLERHGAEAAWLLTLVGALLLAFAIVEPTARAVRHHHRRLDEQAGELERLALVAESTDNLVVVTDAEHHIVWVNDAFTRVSGYTLIEAVGARPDDLVRSGRADAAERMRMEEAIERREGVRVELLNRAKSGHDYWVDIDVRPLHDGAGRLTGFVHIETDITALVSERRQLESLLAVLPDGVVVQSQDGPVVKANPTALRLLGLTYNEHLNSLATDPAWTLLREDLSVYPISAYPALRTLRNGEGLRGEVVGVQAPDATEPRWLLVNTEPLRDALGAPAGVVSCYVDVTERRRLQDRLANLARVDALTDLPNRAEVHARIERAIDHRRRNPGYGFAVLFLDFDHFKDVNDKHGHSVGDELLRQIAQRLQHALRPGDAVSRFESPLGAGVSATQSHTAARIGGDEFVVVVEGVRDASDVHIVAERLLESLTQPYVVQRCQIQSSVSIGVVLSPGDDADGVLRDADIAMYEAKRAGRGRNVIVEAARHDRVAKAVAREASLRRALREREFFIVYQPLLSLGSDDQAPGALGVEALLRWRHPRRGVLLPADFIGTAEEVGLIGELGNFVLETACEQFAHWKSKLRFAAPAMLAVNVSRVQLRDPGMVARVIATLARCNMAPTELQLEVREALIAQDSVALASMNALRAHGVRLALDDFGVGYSSLACLEQMPVDTVKIDRSLVAQAQTSSYHRVVIEATARVAAALGMMTVAEGIETDQQCAQMLSLGCQRGQGYLFCHPLEGDELGRWLAARVLATAATSSARFK